MTLAPSSHAGQAPRFLTVSLARELGALLCLSVMFPFMIHIIPVPENAQLGPRLLPIFYAPLLAALVGRKRTAVVVALLAPWLNRLLTSYPPPPGAVLLMIELLGFVIAIRWLLTRSGAHWYLAMPAYLLGKTGSVLAAALVPALIRGQPALAWGVQTVVIGLPGLAILVLINWLVVRYYPTGPSGGGPAVA